MQIVARASNADICLNSDKSRLRGNKIHHVATSSWTLYCAYPVFFWPPSPLKMVTVSALPREVLLHIFSLLPHRDLVSAGRTCKHWHGLSKDELLLQRIANIWLEAKYFPSNDDMDLAVFLGIMSFKFEILEYYGNTFASFFVWSVDSVSRALY